jgi:hypothetical protein
MAARRKASCMLAGTGKDSWRHDPRSASKVKEDGKRVKARNIFEGFRIRVKD